MSLPSSYFLQKSQKIWIIPVKRRLIPVFHKTTVPKVSLKDTQSVSSVGVFKSRYTIFQVENAITFLAVLSLIRIS